MSVLLVVRRRAPAVRLLQFRMTCPHKRVLCGHTPVTRPLCSADSPRVAFSPCRRSQVTLTIMVSTPSIPCPTFTHTTTGMVVVFPNSRLHHLPKFSHHVSSPLGTHHPPPSPPAAVVSHPGAENFNRHLSLHRAHPVSPDVDIPILARVNKHSFGFPGINLETLFVSDFQGALHRVPAHVL